MARLVSVSQSKGLLLSLNISFLFLLFFFLGTDNHLSQTLSLQSPTPTSKFQSSDSPQASGDSNGGCEDLASYKENGPKCEYIRSNPGCKSEGYINYLQLFYCTCGHNPLSGYLLLVLWLVVLFYLLANTAADYFCSSLEDLSRLLALSPTIAGATLLALGNGAPDVFSSIVAFVGPGAGDVGLNSVLGGALFVSTIVVGVISILVGPREVTVNKSGFVRDVCFFLLVLVALLVILLVGTISIWGAIGFISIYFVYVFVVSSEQVCLRKGPDMDDFKSPLIEKITVEEITILLDRVTNQDNLLPISTSSSFWYYGKKVLSMVEFPLYLPRRLTIPVVSGERWSKPYAVASVTLSPVLLAALWSSQSEELDLRDKKVIYLVGCLVGIVLGASSCVATSKSIPPKRFLFPWLAGGFLMSVVWTYIIAEELVALLVSLGDILGISPSILGLTVLAWGNSLGDLTANVAMALNGGSDGAQVAISGCYGGPIFNIMVGLGLSFLFSTWSVYPSPYVVPKDNSLYQTLGFLVGGLLWAVLILPKKEMKLDRVLGGGLLAIYICFLSLNLVQTLGFVEQNGST